MSKKINKTLFWAAFSTLLLSGLYFNIPFGVWLCWGLFSFTLIVLTILHIGFDHLESNIAESWRKASALKVVYHLMWNCAFCWVLWKVERYNLLGVYLMCILLGKSLRFRIGAENDNLKS